MKVNLKVNKLELLEWYPNNDCSLSVTQSMCYKNNDWLNFYQEIKDGSQSNYGKEKTMLNTWFEVIEEPNYDEWVGEWCVFLDDPIINRLDVTLSKLTQFHENREFPFVTSEKTSYRYCMLLNDYQKMIEEQAK
jgi:hypothetical protein